MARRLIGLDIGTNAVRVAELEPGDPPRLTSFGQVALPPGAMRDGEIVDPAVVTEAIQRLWKELSLKKGPVRVGVATPRVLVRTVDLPTMSDSELAGALQFQAQELIPIPLEDAVLDFQVLESLPTPEPVGEGPPPQPMSRVLLAAAHKDLIRNLTGAVRAAGLPVAGVDLVPLALVRSVGRRVSDNGGGVEAIVSVGGSVTVVVIHELGIPRFVRILGSGGRNVTDAISRELELTGDQAEAIKRQLDAAPVDLAQRARAAMVRPISDLVEQIRGSLDYYRTQPDSIRLLKVTITGGGALTPGLADQLVDTVGVPVDLARPREHIAVGDIGFPDEALPSLDPFLPVPVGLALGGALSGKRIDLLGGETKVAVDRSQLIKVGAIAGVVVLAGLAGLTYLKTKQVDDERAKLADAQRTNAVLQSKIDDLADVSKNQAEIEQRSAQTQALLATDVGWSTVLQAISRTIPVGRVAHLVPGDRERRHDRGTDGSGGAGDPGNAQRHGQLRRRGARLRRGRLLDPAHRHRHPVLRRPLGPERLALLVGDRYGIGHGLGDHRPDGQRDVLVHRDAHPRREIQARRAVQGGTVKRNAMIGMAAALLAVIVAWYFVIYSPKSDDLDQAKTATAAEQKKTADLKFELSRLQSQAKNASQQQALLGRLDQAIPAQPDEAEFILQANSIAAESGIDFLSISPTPPAASGTTTTIGLTLSIEGSFFQVKEYLTKLEGLERLVIVDGINMSAGSSDGTGGDGVTLSVTLTARMFTTAAPPAVAGSDTTTPDAGTSPTSTPADGATTTVPAGSSTTGGT